MSKSWLKIMIDNGYTETEARKLQATHGSIGGAATVKKGLAVLKDKDPAKYAAIRAKALAARRSKK